MLHHFDLSHNRSIDFSRFNTHVRRMETNLGRAFRWVLQGKRRQRPVRTAAVRAAAARTATSAFLQRGVTACWAKRESTSTRLAGLEHAPHHSVACIGCPVLMTGAQGSCP